MLICFIFFSDFICLPNRPDFGVYIFSQGIFLTPYVQEGGDNALGLRVVDSLTNRMIGDASLPQEERYTYAYPEIVKAGDRLVSLGRYR